MTGSVVQLNISKGGLPKRPVPEAAVTPLGLEGDRCAHPEIHGGPQKALLLICAEVVDELTTRGFSLFYGALGENVTTRGLDRRQLRIGQRYRVGEALIELTKIRAPCSELDVYGPGIQDAIYDEAVKDGDPASPRWGMGGFYASVVKTGMVRPGDPVRLVDQLV